MMMLNKSGPNAMRASAGCELRNVCLGHRFDWVPSRNERAGLGAPKIE
jgi:hypothetical protein